MVFQGIPKMVFEWLKPMGFSPLVFPIAQVAWNSEEAQALEVLAEEVGGIRLLVENPVGERHGKSLEHG